MSTAIRAQEKEHIYCSASSAAQTQPVQGRPDASVSESAKAKQPTTNADIDKAIARGSEFKSRLQYLDKGLKRNKVQLASAWAMDGISKYVTFFTDFEAIASAAAQAKQEMRTFTSEDALKLPLTGLIYAHVEILGRGMLPVKKVERRYVKNAAHLVIQYDEEIVQPLSKELKSVSDASFIAPIALYTWWESKNVSLLTGGTLGWEGSKAELEFVFHLTPEQQKRKGKVILIDADGNRHQADVDFSKIFGQ
jgi:hypothetical protein